MSLASAIKCFARLELPETREPATRGLLGLAALSLIARAELEYLGVVEVRVIRIRERSVKIGPTASNLAGHCFADALVLVTGEDRPRWISEERLLSVPGATTPGKQRPWRPVRSRRKDGGGS